MGERRTSSGRLHASRVCSIDQTAVLASLKVFQLIFALSKPDYSHSFLLLAADSGQTSVLAAVYGPAQPKVMRMEKIDRASVDVTFKPLNGVIVAEDKEREQMLRQIFESMILLSMHPRTVVSIVVQVLGDDGSLLSCATNAVCLALMDAGVPMKGLAMSVTCAQLDTGEQLLDPTSAEEERAKAVTVLVHEVRAYTYLEAFLYFSVLLSLDSTEHNERNCCLLHGRCIHNRPVFSLRGGCRHCNAGVILCKPSHTVIRSYFFAWSLYLQNVLAFTRLAMEQKLAKEQPGVLVDAMEA
jgi:hypothetical protein